MRAGYLLVTLALGFSNAALAAPSLAPGYGEGMVLQRDAPIVVAGTTKPGARVEGTLGESTATTTAARDGSFTLQFPARAASTAPVKLTLADPQGSVTTGGLLIGDVYLCSGQSNMELPVREALNQWNTLRTARDADLRLFKVDKGTAPLRQSALPAPARWQAADEATVRDFSAACYFMARELRARRPEVPVGLIHSNWGGSAASAWLDPEAVGSLHGRAALTALADYNRDPMLAAQRFAPEWYDWWRTQDGGREPWKTPDSLDWRSVPQISFWNAWTGSGLDVDPTGTVWLRRTLTLTADQAKRGGTLNLGALDDLDLTWVNGTVVGYTFGWGVERAYRLPPGVLKTGENSILVALNNMWDTGGFFAGADRLFFTPADGGPSVSMGDGWQYARSPVKGTPPRAPWDANAGFGVMHNAMIAPLGPMRLAGVAWYQGESDIGRGPYETKLAALFQGFRRQFGPQARMLVVQLADWGPRQSTPAASGWAELRQDQIDGVVADRNAGLVTAIDIGEPTDIHPANKNDLGKRLALAALGEAMPMPAGARREGATVVVEFTGVSGSLAAQGGPVALGVELCGATQDSCRFVLPRIDGTRLVIAGDGKPASRVRHAWADAPIVNLYDARGLPVPGFELAIAP